MSVQDKFGHWLYKITDLHFSLLIIGLLVFKTGVWCVPNLMMVREISLNPFDNPFQDPNAHYLYWSWLGPFAAWLMGLNEPTSFFIYHLFFSVAFPILFVCFVYKKFSREVARTSIIVYALLPVSSTAFLWVGPDSITLFLMLLSLTLQSIPILSVFIGIMLGMQHFEQSAIAFVVLLGANLLSRYLSPQAKANWQYCVYSISGILLGKALLVFLFDRFRIEINSGRSYWLENHFEMLLNQFWFHSSAILWSVLGLAWIVLLKWCDTGKKSIPFTLSLASLFILLPLSADQTRVFAIVAFPLVFVYWLSNQEFIQSVPKREAAMLYLVWIFMPIQWVWEGVPKWSVLPYDITLGLHMLFGWFHIPDALTIWPFR